MDTDKPVEDTPEVYRFQTPVKAGETKTFTVKEEKDIASSMHVDQQRRRHDPVLHQPHGGEPGTEAEADGGVVDQERAGTRRGANWPRWSRTCSG